MLEMFLKVLSPTSERQGIELAQPVPHNRRPSLNPGLRVGLLGNSKANVVELFEGMEQGLRPFVSNELVVVDKGNSAVPAPAALLDELASRCDLVITAMAD